MNVRMKPGRAALAADPAPTATDSIAGRRRRATQKIDTPAATATNTAVDGPVIAVRRADRVRSTLCRTLRLDCNKRISTASISAEVGVRIMASMT
jgi:hypothetical protein